MLNREKIALKDVVIEGDIQGTLNGFTFISTITEEKNTEENCYQITVVIQRNKDNKFFKITYKDYGNGTDILDQIGVETFPSFKKKIIYN